MCRPKMSGSSFRISAVALVENTAVNAPSKPPDFPAPRANQLNGFARGAGKSGGFDGAFTAVFSTKATAEIRNDDPDIFGRHIHRAGQLDPDRKWILRAGPDGELIILPFSNG